MRLDIERPTPSVLLTRYRPIHTWIVAGLLGAMTVAIVAIVVATVPVAALLADETGVAAVIYGSVVWMACGPACVTALIGVLFVVFLGRIDVCTLNKATGTVVFERRGVLGVQTTERRLDEILRVEVKSRSGSRGKQWHRIYLVFASGERLPIMTSCPCFAKPAASTLPTTPDPNTPTLMAGLTRRRSVLPRGDRRRTRFRAPRA